jgi:hypothetical protein
MGTNVSVHTPPAGTSKYGELVGDVRLARSMWATLVQLGLVEKDCIEDGIFHLDHSDEEIERILSAVDVQIKVWNMQLDCWGNDSAPTVDFSSIHDVKLYIEEWRELYHTMRVFRSHGIHATLGGG